MIEKCIDKINDECKRTWYENVVGQKLFALSWIIKRAKCPTGLWRAPRSFSPEAPCFSSRQNVLASGRRCSNHREELAHTISMAHPFSPADHIVHDPVLNEPTERPPHRLPTFPPSPKSTRVSKASHIIGLRKENELLRVPRCSRTNNLPKSFFSRLFCSTHKYMSNDVQQKLSNVT